MGITSFQLDKLNHLPLVRRGFVIHYTPARFSDLDRYINNALAGLLPGADFNHTRNQMILANRIRNPGIVHNHRMRRGVLVHEVRPLPFDYRFFSQEPNKKCFSKPAAVAIGPITLKEPLIVNYRSTNNQIRGIIKRVAHDVQANQVLLASFRQFVANYVKRYEPLPYFENNHDILNEYWLNDAHQYTVKQKQRFHDLLDLFLNAANQEVFIKHYQDKIYLCDSFIKREFYDEVKEPRIINARPDLFKAIVAPYIKQIEHKVIYNDHFIKGKQPDMVAKRMLEICHKYKYVAETDYSSFEGSFSDRFLVACEYQLLHHMLSNNPRIFRIIKEIYFKKNRLVLKTSKFNKDHCEVPGSRMSGEMWTSLANGFTNMMLFMFTSKKSVSRRAWKSIGSQCDFIVEGDDGFFGFNYDIDMTVISQLGFTIKLNMASDINDLSFCGICVANDGTAVPCFRRTLVKFGYCHDETVITKYSDKTTKLEKQFMRAKAMSLLATSSGNPIFQPLALKILDLTKDVHPKSYMFDWWEQETFDILHMNISPKDITEDIRIMYEQRYYISIKEQIRLETLIKCQTALRFILPIDFNEDKFKPTYFSL